MGMILNDEFGKATMFQIEDAYRFKRAFEEKVYALLALFNDPDANTDLSVGRIIMDEAIEIVGEALKNKTKLESPVGIKSGIANPPKAKTPISCPKCGDPWPWVSIGFVYDGSRLVPFRRVSCSCGHTEDMKKET